MIDFEDVKKYLPHHLSGYANESLFSELKPLPNQGYKQ
jgi:hypothetical protein